MNTVVFDFDGTLVDSEKIYLQTLLDLLETYSIPAEKDVFEDLRSRHPDCLFDHLLGREAGQQALQDFKASSRKLSSKVRLFPGVLEVLESLKSKGLHVAVWTARDLESTNEILNNLALSDFFDIVRSGTCVAKNKPSNDGLMAVSKGLEVPVSKMMMVGDHSHDIQAANSLGCTSVFARWKDEPNTLSHGLEATQTFDQLSLFHQWLEETVG